MANMAQLTLLIITKTVIENNVNKTVEKEILIKILILIFFVTSFNNLQNLVLKLWL